jgi:hypothetical protein
MTLNELILRCEEADGADRLLDANIHWQVRRDDFESDRDYAVVVNAGRSFSVCSRRFAMLRLRLAR